MDAYTILNSQFTVFTEPKSGKKFAKCSHCASLLKYHHSTSSLTYHLKSKHSVSSATKFSGDVKPTISQLPTPETGISKHNNPSFKNDGDLAIHLTKWIASDARPLDILEDEGLRNILRVATGSANLVMPSKRSILANIETLYDKQKAVVKDMLKQAEFITLSTDSWMSNKGCYFFVRCHYISSDWSYNSMLLGVQHSTSTNGIFDVPGQVSNLQMDYGNEIEKKSSHLVGDSQATLHSADLLKLDRTPCMAHSLLATVNKAMAGCSLNLQWVASEILGHYQSCIERHSLSSASETLLLESLYMSEDTDTTWRRTFVMADILLKNRHELSNQLSAEEWTEISDVHELFEPVEKAISILGGEEYKTASSILPLLAYLRQQMAPRPNDSTYALEFKQAFINQLNINTASTLQCLSLQVATAFDIRYKRLLSVPKKKREDVWAAIKSITRVMVETTASCQAPLVKKPRSSILSLASDDAEDMTSEMDAEAEPYLSEFEMYMRLPQVNDDDFCPFKWWKENASTYPTLSKIAKKFLAIPSASVPCERIFSNAGEKLQRKICALLPDNVNKILCLSDWLAF